jgi:glycosyltransferase involved in cell wall biosynthesis
VSHPVGLVHDWLTGQRGGEHVLVELARLFPRAPIYTLFHFPGSVAPELEAHPIVTSFVQRAPGLDPWYRWYLPLFPLAVDDLDVSGHRLVASTSHCVAKGARPAPGAFHLCYCHTPMRYAWDQQASYFGGSGPVTLLQRSVLAALRRWDVASAPRVSRFVANSHFVAERIRRYYGREALVLPPPVDTGFFTPEPGRPREHVLVVAALAPYKRVDRAVQACAALGLPLVVVGDGPERARLERLAGPGTRLAGRVSAAELGDLYRGAICLLQPGIEDFGIAAVEALACGTPVVARGEGGVLDIVADGRHGVLFEGDDPGVIGAAVDKCRKMQSNFVNLRERAEVFSAHRFAPGILRILMADWPVAEGILA